LLEIVQQPLQHRRQLPPDRVIGKRSSQREVTARHHHAELGEQAPQAVADDRARLWKPQKYASKHAQDAMLDNLQAWVAGYYDREDAWSLQAHRRIFDAFSGCKREYTHVGGLSSPL